MTSVSITVQGSHSERHPAERAVIRATVAASGADRDLAFAETAAAADELRAQIEGRADAGDGAIVEWSSNSIRTWSERGWSASGERTEPVFSASVDFGATFADFAALSEWIDSAMAITGVSIDSVTWTLTDEASAAAIDAARAAAVADAVAKATVYARSVGLSEVEVVAIADPGMLGDGSTGPGGGPGFARAMKSQSYDSSSPQVLLKPQPIVVECSVDARFTAR